MSVVAGLARKESFVIHFHLWDLTELGRVSQPPLVNTATRADRGPLSLPFCNEISEVRRVVGSEENAQNSR